MDNRVYDLYRKDSDDGQHTKDWAIAVDAQAQLLCVRFGRTGTGMRSRTVKVSGALRQEQRERITVKKKEGYRFVGQRRLDRRGKWIEPGSQPQGKARTLFWAWDRRVDLGQLFSVLEKIAGQLSDTWPYRVTWSAETLSLIVCRNNETVFTLGNGAGVTPDGRGAGTVGSKTGPVPVVVLLALRRTVGTIVFTENDDVIPLNAFVHSGWLDSSDTPSAMVSSWLEKTQVVVSTQRYAEESPGLWIG